MDNPDGESCSPESEGRILRLRIAAGVVDLVIVFNHEIKFFLNRKKVTWMPRTIFL